MNPDFIVPATRTILISIYMRVHDLLPPPRYKQKSQSMISGA